MDKENLDIQTEKAKKKAKKRAKALQKMEDEQLMQALEVDEEKLKSLKKKLTKMEGFPERGIETWYRLASKNLYTRRQIVDTKSNILITVNSIMISALLGTLYPRLGDDPHLIYGIVPIVLGNLISIAYAIFATRPNLGTGVFKPEEINNHKAHLTTFDDYYRMPQADYENALDEMMKDGNFLYGTIKRELYRLGVDLSRRYNSIRIAYNVFLIGLTIGLFLFGFCHVYF